MIMMRYLIGYSIAYNRQLLKVFLMLLTKVICPWGGRERRSTELAQANVCQQQNCSDRLLNV